MACNCLYKLCRVYIKKESMFQNSKNIMYILVVKWKQMASYPTFLIQTLTHTYSLSLNFYAA